MGNLAFKMPATILAVILFALPVATAAAETLRIGGTGVALGSIRVLAKAHEAHHPETVIEVLPSLGSGGGVKAVTAQAIDLGLSSRPLKETETAKGAAALPYARTQLAFVTSPDNDVPGITTEDLEAIYSGAITHWPNDTPIRLVMRPAAEAATRVLRRMSEGMDRAVSIAMKRPGLVTAITDQDNAEALERMSGSFGLLAIGQIRTEDRQLKVLALDGKFPGASAADSPENGFGKTVYLVMTEALSPAASDFRDFVLSDEARAILSAHDFTPVD